MQKHYPPHYQNGDELPYGPFWTWVIVGVFVAATVGLFFF